MSLWYILFMIATLSSGVSSSWKHKALGHLLFVKLKIRLAWMSVDFEFIGERVAMTAVMALLKASRIRQCGGGTVLEENSGRN